MGGKRFGQYHFYGPIWVLQVIPELARETGVHSGQLTVPRCLRWTFSRPATDPATLLQRASRVVTLVPSPEDTGTSYYLSMQLEPGAQSVRFVPSRSGNKKKMLANAVSCCSISAGEVVPPSARGTRAARTPQKGRQATSRPSSSALRDEPDPDYISDAVIPRVRELIDTTIAPRVQEYVDRAIDRALAGLSSCARRSPTSDFRDHHSPEPSDRGAAHRAPTPPLRRAPQPTVVQEGTSTSAPRPVGFSAPYQLMNGIDDSILKSTYSRFRLSGPDANFKLQLNGLSLWKKWFDELEVPSQEMREETLVGAWKRLHPLNPDCLEAYGDDDYQRWRPAEGLIHGIRRTDGKYQVP
ncbi:hypothetical protein C2S53_013450 [Perilla frutescens var. hirtella]|uniref:Uncharacterized protein n=1 Tax=Perilla frutescens var. hirtella TaxID=608512 RepID=A0AAD4NWV6_PERFH|nr:hypothetical protein C2S53_013450 [Perilla frutescens var. hirtella]